ncbi:MAG TPA: hypothetical protein VGD10_06145 [Allosphingosinicella sp.]|uniref:hypothetical protein n=1 Tax=Allosphingosinicella sp. TaxID=2823234 RepID=UPI002ED942A3
MQHCHRFEAVSPVYAFRGGEQAHVRFEVAAVDEAGAEFVLQVKDVSTLGFIAVCTRLPETGETLTVRLPGLNPVKATVAFCTGHWAGYNFEKELDWDLLAQAILAADAAASRTPAAA